MSKPQVMPRLDLHVKLGNMSRAEQWTGRRMIFRAVQTVMLAYGAREAVRFMRHYFTKP